MRPYLEAGVDEGDEEAEGSQQVHEGGHHLVISVLILRVAGQVVDRQGQDRCRADCKEGSGPFLEPIVWKARFSSY